jgi:Caspase domain
MTRKFLLMAALLLGAIAGAAATSPTGDKDIVAALPREAISSPAASNHGPEAVPGSKRSAPRLALVIGNARYPDAETPLPGVTEDARALADGLKRSGFQVEIEENLTRDGLRDALDHFEAKITPGAAALLFFDGFGIQAGRQSYLIPVDAQIWVEADVRRCGISVESVLSEMSEKGAGAKIAIIDASRRNPFERRFRSFSSGLASADAPNGALVFYANSPGKVAIEGDRDPFVLELLAAIRTPGLSADEVFSSPATPYPAPPTASRCRSFPLRWPRISISGPCRLRRSKPSTLPRFGSRLRRRR